jgi:hypothetical protein
MAKCEVCGKDIEKGKEVKKGFFRRKYYHPECFKK